MQLTPAPQFLSPLGILSGVVATHLGERDVIRRRYTDLPPTPKQLLVRAAFTAADFHWRQLDEPSKDLWRNWKPWYAMWGYSLFMRVNIPRCYSGQPPLLTPPDYPPWV